MPAKTYAEIRLNFREESSSAGLRVTFSQLFSVIPAALGHFLDRLFGIDQLIFKNNDSFLSGPFGFILGIIPYLIGIFVGELLQQILNIPMYIGFIFDKAINGIVSLFTNNIDFNKGMLGELPGIGGSILGVVYGLYIFMTQKPPELMSGPVAFFLGAISQTARFVFNRIIENFVCPIQFGIHALCHAIKPSQAHKDEPKVESSEASKGRFRRPKDNLAPEGSDLRQVEVERIDLFETLQITLEAFEADPNCVNKAFRKLSVSCHPDKNTTNDPALHVQFDNLNKAKSILTHEKNGKEYLNWYKTNMAKSASPAFYQPASPSQQPPSTTPGRSFKRPGPQ